MVLTVCLLLFGANTKDGWPDLEASIFKVYCSSAELRILLLSSNTKSTNSFAHILFLTLLGTRWLSGIAADRNGYLLCPPCVSWGLMMLWTTAVTESCTVPLLVVSCCSVELVRGAASVGSGTNCTVGPEEDAVCKAWVTATTWLTAQVSSTRHFRKRTLFLSLYSTYKYVLIYWCFKG